MPRPIIFMINLDIAEERLSFMRTQAMKAGVDLERIAGVPGAQVPVSLRDQFLNPEGRQNSPLSAGEIGCYASHLEAAQQLVSRNLTAAVVLEDDVELSPGFGELLERVLQHLPLSWDIVKLCNYPDRAVYSMGEIDGTHLVRFYRQPALAAGYLLSNQGARKLLAPRPRVRPIDLEMRQPWHIGLDVYGLCPPPVTQVRTMRSYIKDADDYSPARGYGKHRFRTFLYAARSMGLAPALSCRVMDWFCRGPRSQPNSLGVWIPYARERTVSADSPTSLSISRKPIIS